MKRMGIRNWSWIIFLFHIVTFLAISQEITTNDNKIRTVVIDPGHGGKDPGGIGKKSQEKDIALAISLKAGKYIENNFPNVKVIYTRTTDEYIQLHERAKIANDNEADLFISIHVNSNPKTSPYGTSSHVLGLHRMNENFEVAKRENSVILMEDDYETRYENFDPNSPESYIIFSLMQNVYFDQSLIFSQKVQDQFRERAQRKDRGVKQQGLLVLAQASMPGVLIETGFISNPTEEKYLMSKDGQDYLASAIYRAFREYKLYIENDSPINQIIITENIDKTPANQDTTSVHEDSIQPKTNDSLNEASQKKLKNVNPTISSQIDGVIFKVQILFSENKIDLKSDLFNDFNDVEEISSDGKYKYVVGSKTSYQEAIEYSKWVKSRHPDAFIVAVSKGKIIPVSEAIDLENTN